MFGYILNKYIQSDFFTFQLGESFEQKCNAPKDKCGIYLRIYIFDCTKIATLFKIGRLSLIKRQSSLQIFSIINILYRYLFNLIQFCEYQMYSQSTCSRCS